MIESGSSTHFWSNLIKRSISTVETTRTDFSEPPFPFYDSFFEQMAQQSDEVARELYTLSRLLGPGEALDTVALMVRLNEKLKAAVLHFQTATRFPSLQRLNVEMTHQLRNPIANLRTYTEMLSLLESDHTKLHRLRQPIAKMNRLTTLVSDMTWLVAPHPRHRQSAVSLLHVAQTPNTFDKPARVTLSGRGVLCNVLAHQQALRQAVSHVCWVLAGSAPNNHIQIDSEIKRGMALLTLWNAALSLKPETIARYEDELERPLLQRRDRFDGVILPLTIATRLLQTDNGWLTVSHTVPTRIRLALPLEVGARPLPI